VTTHYIYIYIYIYKIESHSGMTISHPTNSKYTFDASYVPNTSEYNIYATQIKSHKLSTVINNRAIHLSIYIKLNQSINYRKKKWLYKIHVTYDTSHIQKVFIKHGLSESDKPTIEAKNLNRSIPASHGPHRRMRYLQPKH
jgi:hypothetical protein